MPIESKAQMRWLGWAERHGKVRRGTLHRRARETPNLHRLPERKHSRKPRRKSIRRHRRR